MIKGRNPFPFETIVLGVSFNPGLPSLIGETKRLCELHNATAIFIHVGKKTSEKQRDLMSILTLFGFHDGNSRIYWEQGEVISSVLKVCKNEVADLLIMGLSQRSDFQLPAGQISKGIAIKAKCSVLIYCNRPSGAYKNIIVNASEHKKTELTISTALYFAEKENANQILVSESENGSFDESSNTITESDRLSISGVTNKTGIKLNYVSLTKENCKTINEYAFRNSIDLIITNSSDHHLLIFDRITSHDGIESLLNDLACNLLIVHSRGVE